MVLSPEAKLQERIKELRCLYDLLTVMQRDLPIEEAFPEFAKIIAAAFLHASETIVELQFETFHLWSNPASEQTVYIQKELLVFEENLGFIKVHYPASKHAQHDFMPEELLLLNKVAAEIGSFCEKKITQNRNALFERNVAHMDRLSILGEITAGIAHELNTPLGNILGFAELIQKQDGNSQTQADVSKIIKSAVYSREIVKKLMFFSCDIPQKLESVKIHTFFVQVLTLLGPHFRKAKVVPQLLFESEQLEARIDSIQFTQVLFNILINSIYAAPENSTVLITVTHDETHLYFEITDQGAGIPDAIKPKIFEPFFTTKPFGEGTGLGLSVVHGILKSHGGSIAVKDHQPCGVAFCVRLPLN